MLKRIFVTLSLVLATALFTAGFTPRAVAQDTPQDISQDPGPKRTINIFYDHDGIVLSGTGDDAVKYKGLIYLKIYPVTPRLIKKYGSGPIYSNEIYPYGGGGHNPVTYFQLPLGKYEVHFSKREGEAMRTGIKNVILTANSDVSTEVEMSGASQTLIIGGDDMTAKEMRDSIVALKQQVAALQAQIADLKTKAK